MTKGVNLSKFYSSFTSFINLTFSLNDTSLTSFMLVILLKLLIQSDHHLLGKRTPHWSQQLSMTKTRQSGHLRRFWIYDIQNQTVTFNTRFADLTVTLILSDIIQIAMRFRIYLKLYINIMHDTLINQVHSLLNWSWFATSQ